MKKAVWLFSSSSESARYLMQSVALRKKFGSGKVKSNACQKTSINSKRRLN
jgi:hypothetical protein